MPPHESVTCRLCGVVIRDDDSIVIVDDAPLHLPCAESAAPDPTAWKHTDVTTLSQWARGIGWGSSPS